MRITRSLRPWMLCTANPVGAFGAAICSPEPSAVYGDGTPLLLLACMLLLMCHKPQAIASHRKLTPTHHYIQATDQRILHNMLLLSFDATKSVESWAVPRPCKTLVTLWHN
jgi:hypothetical protein